MALGSCAERLVSGIVNPTFFARGVAGLIDFRAEALGTAAGAWEGDGETGDTAQGLLSAFLDDGGGVAAGDTTAALRFFAKVGMLAGT